MTNRELVFASMRLASKRTADGNIEVHLYSDHTGMLNPYNDIDVPDLYVVACLGEVEQNGKVISKFSWGVWENVKDDGSYTMTLLLDSNGIEAYKKHQAQFKEAIEEYKSYDFSISKDLSANMPVKQAVIESMEADGWLPEYGDVADKPSKHTGPLPTRKNSSVRKYADDRQKHITNRAIAGKHSGDSDVSIYMKKS